MYGMFHLLWFRCSPNCRRHRRQVCAVAARRALWRLTGCEVCLAFERCAEGAPSAARKAETSGTVSHTFDSAGTYEVLVMVEDDDGATDTATIVATVGDSPVTGVVYAINTGGSSYTADDGTVYSADTAFSGGNT